MPSPALYPLLIQRKLVSRIWGGQRVAHWLNLEPPYPAHLAETWEVFESNPIRNGDLAGWTLAEVTREYGAQLIGKRPFERYGYDFPLLTKFIDAYDHLSIQVHPDDDYAHQHEAASGFHGKTEAWYILWAEPGADIIYGVNQSVDKAAFTAAVQNGTLECLIHYVPVQAGDVILVPAGTLHAINSGIMLFEIQEKSDLTYRVYDYGRLDRVTCLPRQLHLDKALDVMHLHPPHKVKSHPVALEPGVNRMLLLACSFFALESMLLSGQRQMHTHADSLEILTVIEGQGRIAWEGGTLELCHGDSVVLPAALGAWSLQSRSALHVLRGYVPDLERNILVPLKQQGLNDEQIIQILGDV
jgi:mannose-6-phosphate isomerase